MFYIMNTQSKTPTLTPQDNEYGHSGANVSFLYLQSGKSVKVVATYGTVNTPVGAIFRMTQDTGLGHRSMPDHTLVAVVTNGGVRGTLPTTKNLPFWVCK